MVRGVTRKAWLSDFNPNNCNSTYLVQKYKKFDKSSVAAQRGHPWNKKKLLFFNPIYNFLKIIYTGGIFKKTRSIHSSNFLKKTTSVHISITVLRWHQWSSVILTILSHCRLLPVEIWKILPVKKLFCPIVSWALTVYVSWNRNTIQKDKWHMSWCRKHIKHFIVSSLNSSHQA